MPQMWKIKRELLRAVRQFRNLPSNLFDAYLGRHYNDKILAKKRRILQGVQPASSRQAIYLMFPKHGLLETHRLAIEYLNRKGLSVTIVSNLPLTAEDEAAVLNLCHRYIERPNFGYDFGGYREAVLTIAPELPDMEQLVLLNDSAWFPLTDKTDWLDDVAALNVDFAGSVSHYGLPRPKAVDFREMTYEFETDHHHFHYGSYALSIGANVLKYPGFLQFWKELKFANKKDKAVRYGETGLSRWALNNGFTHGDTLGVSRLADKLNALSDQQLIDAAERIIIFDDKEMRRLRHDPALKLQEMPREDLIRFLMTAAARQGPGYVIAYATTLAFGYPFLKKLPVWHNPEAAEISLEILKTIDTPVARAALEEVAAVTASKRECA